MRRRTAIFAALILATLLVGAALVVRRWRADEPDESHASCGRPTELAPATSDSKDSATSPSKAEGALAAAGSRGSAEEREPTVRVTGRVVDERRMPVAGAQVTVVTVEPAAPPVTTDADGRFALTTGFVTMFWSGNDRKDYVIALRATAGGRFAVQGFDVVPPQHD